ncbi:hypothetical protein KA977_07545 [Candidatus Dependentiae bacterium]|nr:hypothetical protein [Candidatus Dependentiae bacterium]
MNLNFNKIKYVLIIVYIIFIFEIRVSCVNLETQRVLSDIAIIILYENQFQDYLRQNSLDKSFAIFMNINDKINGIIEKGILSSDLKIKLKTSADSLKIKLLNNNYENKAEIEFNNLIKTLYECYNNFEITDSPEINYFIIDLNQFQNYILKKNWDYMIAEVNEMIDFYGVVVERFNKKKLSNPFNMFLLKYFKINLENLRNSVLDKDLDTTKNVTSELVKLLKNFQYIYESNKKKNEQ